MELGIQDRVALVAGGSRGCGFAIASALAREGARVVLTGRNAEAVAEAVEAIKAEGHTVMGVVGDMNVKADVRRFHEEARRIFGEVTILVINPAMSNLKGGFENTTDEAFIEFEQRLDHVTRLSGARSPAGNEGSGLGTRGFDRLRISEDAEPDRSTLHRQHPRVIGRLHQNTVGRVWTKRYYRQHDLHRSLYE